MPKRLEYQIEGDLTIIRMHGEMSFFFLEELNAFIKAQAEAGRTRFVYDMSDVSWIDSIGLGVIAATVKTAQLNGQKIGIVQPRENVKKLLEMSCLLELMDEFESQDKAIAAYRTKA